MLTHLTRWNIVALFLACGSACSGAEPDNNNIGSGALEGPPAGQQPSSNNARCLTERVDGASSTAWPGGVGPADARASIRGERSARIAWADGALADLHVTVQDLDGYFVTASAPTSATNMPIVCQDYLAVRAAVLVDTSDGRLHEEFDALFTSTDGVNYNAQTQSIERAALIGSYGDAPIHSCVTDVSIYLHVAPGAFHGTVLEQTLKTGDQCGDQGSLGAVSEATAAEW